MRMSLRLLTVTVALCVPSAAPGIVDFTATVPYEAWMVCESIPLVVRIKNNQSVPLAAGQDGFLMSVVVRDDRGLAIRRLPDSKLIVPELIPPNAEVQFTNDLTSLFRLVDHPAVSVRVQLTIGRQTLESPPTHLDIVKGMEIARIRGRAKDGEIRTYTLRTLNRGKRERLFLRIDDADESVCYGVVELGRYVPFGKPALDIDEEGNIHILHLSGPNQFTHSVYTPNAVRVSVQVVEGDVNAVKLVRDERGGIRVAGAGVVSPPRDPMVEPLPLKRGL